MNTSTIAFTMYPVTDMPRATAFYRDALGLKATDVASDFWQEFDIDGATFGIGNFEQVGKAGTAQSLALEIPDLDAFLAGLKERGIDTTPPHQLTNCRIAVVTDPDGNQIWLHQRKG